MSQTTETQTGDEPTVNKKVDIVCYLDREDGETRRQFADRVDADRDFFDKKVMTWAEEDYFIRTKESEVEIDEETYEELKDDSQTTHIVFKEGTEHEDEEYKFRPIRPLREMRDDITDGVFGSWLDANPLWSRSNFSPYLYDADDDLTVRVGDGFKRMPMLKHKSEITPEDMYEDEDEEYLVYKVSVSLKGVPKSRLDEFDEEITGPIMQGLARHEWVDRVRLYDCEMETQEKGVCFNI